MGAAKNCEVRVIPANVANPFMRKNHYSGKIVNNSALHFGIFYFGNLSGVLSYGTPLDKRKMLPLVPGTKWNEMLELNRMALIDALPRNSESRCLAISFRLIRKNAPHIKWIASFADATQCGDGTIYRASGFKLYKIKANANIAVLPNGSKIHKMTLESNPTSARPELNGKSYYEITGGRYDFKGYCKHLGATILSGFQLLYIKTLHEGLTVAIEEIPFSRIADVGATMYKGEKAFVA